MLESYKGIIDNLSLSYKWEAGVVRSACWWAPALSTAGHSGGDGGDGDGDGGEAPWGFPQCTQYLEEVQL